MLHVMPANHAKDKQYQSENQIIMNQKPPRIPDWIKAKIVETVSLSKLTIIVGPTGSGKSTLIPPLLLDELNGRILCSQP